MDPIKLGSGDNCVDQSVSPMRYTESKEAQRQQHDNDEEDSIPQLESKVSSETITLNSIEDHENRLKDRISQCRNIIESLKLELREEKAKVERETKSQHPPITAIQPKTEDMDNYSICSVSNADDFLGEFGSNANKFSASVESKLNYDENLMEYEKQLEKYQTTLNMAQMEKKNAIRKQMLTKAYRLKLLELENQCNIELLRVKQSLQCLEPLQMIADKWKTESNENAYDLDKYELLPHFPELSSATTNITVDFEDNTTNQIAGTDDNKSVS